MDRIADTTKTLTSSMSDAMPEVLSKPSARALLMINLAPIIGGLNQVCEPGAPYVCMRR